MNLFKPFNLEVNKKIRGSAMQLAIFSSLVLGGGGYYMSTSTDAVVKASRSFASTNMKKALGVKLFSVTKSQNALFKSSDLDSGLKKECLLDLSKCPAKGAFKLYTENGTLISGDYNRFGQNCSDSKYSAEKFCSSANKLITVSLGSYEVKGTPKRFHLSYTTYEYGNPSKKYLDNYLTDSFEVSGLGDEKICGTSGGKSQYVTGMNAGEVVCSRPIAFVGPRGDDGANGRVGSNGSRGPMGLKGPPGPRGPRGSLYWIRTGGCFDGATKIQLADGSLKEIKEVLEHDKILNPLTGEIVNISRIVTGPEELPMVTVNTSKLSVKITLDHPMVVKDVITGYEEIIPAHKLAAGDLVKTENGFDFVSNVKQSVEMPGYQVYNILLEGGKDISGYMMTANGFVTGDLFIQKLIMNNDGVVSAVEPIEKYIAH